MIQPNEKLFPGNVVMFNGMEKGDYPIVLDGNHIHQIQTNNLRCCEFFSPIPLTPEILVQWCGFTKGLYAFSLIMGEYNVCIVFEDDLLSILDSNGNSVNVGIPQHLHTLQNLIYFLSGEEMPVNIPNN